MMASKDNRIVPVPLPDSKGPLQDFICLVANAADAFTAALLIYDPAEKVLRSAACQSLSDHIVPDAVFRVESTLLGDLFLRGRPSQETYFQGDSTQLGIYSESEPIRAYMAAPVGNRGLLWADTRKTYRFTARHLKMLLELARNAANLLELSKAAVESKQRASKINLVAEMLPEWGGLTDPAGHGLGRAVTKLSEEGAFDGVLCALRTDENNLFRITASAGFSRWVRKGRLVRGEAGWIPWCVENRLPKFVSGLERGEESPVLFHKGERVGFEVRSLAVVPWEGFEGAGVLSAASRSPRPWEEIERTSLVTIARLAGLVRSVSVQHRVLQGIRKHDGESGLVSEGYFRELSREAFSRAEASATGLLLLLVSVEEMDAIYLQNDCRVVNRFLVSVADMLSGSTGGRGLWGKFRTGGFGLLMENSSLREAASLCARIRSAMGSCVVTAAGRQIRFAARIASACYPEECEDLHGLWKVALSRLALPRSPKT